MSAVLCLDDLRKVTTNAVGLLRSQRWTSIHLGIICGLRPTFPFFGCLAGKEIASHNKMTEAHK
jgi:hypothetical protein